MNTLTSILSLLIFIMPLATIAYSEDGKGITFSEYALSQDRSDDEIYTIELVIDRIRTKNDPAYWDDFLDLSEARMQPDYNPQFSKAHLKLSEKFLHTVEWLSLQKTHVSQRPIRNIEALKFLPNLSTLHLISNEVTDITPLSHCKKLTELSLSANPIKDLSPIVSCTKIEMLNLSESALQDLSPLEKLLSLTELTLNNNEMLPFSKLKELKSLKILNIDADEPVKSFSQFPSMPSLKVITGAEIDNLNGIEKFTKLESLSNLSGKFDSLEKLMSLDSLTNFNIYSCRISSLSPLANHKSLRYIFIDSEHEVMDLITLESIPNLHAVRIQHKGDDIEGLEAINKKLTPWSAEFGTLKPRYKPNLKLQVVSQEEFDIYDSESGYNVEKDEHSHGLLSLELEWLIKQVDATLSVNSGKTDDYEIPYNWTGARSFTVYLSSDKVINNFSKLALDMQAILSIVKKDWIIYFQGEGENKEFICWLYPDKVITTEEYEKTIRDLIKN